MTLNIFPFFYDFDFSFFFISLFLSHFFFFFFFLMIRRPPSSTLFPSPTLFRSLLTLAGAVAIVLAGLAGLAALVVMSLRAVRQRDAEAARTEVGELARLQAETGLRIERSEEHTSELQSPCNLVCRLLLEKKKHK